MRKSLAITAATVLSLGVLGGGAAIASNGTADQDRDRSHSCSQDCDGSQQRDRSQDGLAGSEQQHQERHQYRHAGEGAC